MTSSEIAQAIRQTAKDVGFELAGVASVRDFPELDYFPEWISAGHAGEMKYMEARDDSGQLKRASLKRVAPWARSVVVCAINYNTALPYSTQVGDPYRGWISRYAWSQHDYHHVLMQRLRQLENSLRQMADTEYRTASTETTSQAALDPDRPETRVRTAKQCSETGTDLKPLQTRCYVDTGPIVERVYAKYAGIGWIGKNTCILNQKLGSWLFLGVMLTSLELTADLPAPDRCGTCTRCIDACPTHALIEPYQLDAKRCISYLTIEQRGSIPNELREGMGRHLFGCDICQDVCPWNRKAPVTTAAEFQPQAGLVNPALDWLAEMKVEEFRETFRDSPIKRTKLSGLRRNAVVAMGNSGKREFLPDLAKLARDKDPVVAESARWAIQKLGS